MMFSIYKENRELRKFNNYRKAITETKLLSSAEFYQVSIGVIKPSIFYVMNGNYKLKSYLLGREV